MDNPLFISLVLIPDRSAKCEGDRNWLLIGHFKTLTMFSISLKLFSVCKLPDA